jgi:hypothetical protein
LVFIEILAEKQTTVLFRAPCSISIIAPKQAIFLSGAKRAFTSACAVLYQHQFQI